MTPRITVYTAIVGDYETLRNPDYVDPRVEYVCFTDEPLFHRLTNNTVWQIRGIPRSRLDNTRKNRRVKILSHEYLAPDQCDYSVYVDGNINIIGDVVDLVARHPNLRLLAHKHPKRQCIYQEAVACAALEKDRPSIIEHQMAQYRSEGFPSDFGLTSNGVLIRRHADPDVRALMTLWWSQVERYSKRDQLSFCYCAWKLGFAWETPGDVHPRSSSTVFRIAPGWRTKPKTSRIHRLLARQVGWRLERLRRA